MTKGEKEDARPGAEERYKALLETAGDAIFSLDLLGRFSFINPAGERMSGYSEEELLGKHFREFLPPKYIPACLNLFQRLLRGQPAPPIEIEMITKQSERVPLEALGRPVKRGGKAVEVIGIAREITERKRAEEALLESEEKYRNVAERANDGIVIIQDTIIRYANPRLAEMWGGTVQEFIDTPFTDYVHPDELPKLVDRYKRRMAGQDVTPIYETALARKDGSKLYAELNAGIITYQGKPADLVIVRDITERKQAEETLRKSEERYRKQFEEAMDAIFIADAETGVIVDCNRVASALVGREKSEVVGKHQRILHPPEEIEGEFSRTFKQHLKEKEGQVLETQVITKKGEIKDVAIKASTFELEGQKMILGIFRDITEQKRMEEALDRERDLFHTLMNNIPDRIYFKDTQGHFVRVSRALADMHGLSEPAEAVGKTDFDFFGEEPARQFCVSEQEVMQSGQPLMAEEQKEIWLDGRETWCLTSIMPFRDNKGKIIGTFGIARDITERKQAEEEAHKRLREITALHRVSEVINATLDLKEVFHRVVEELSSTFGYHLIGIYLVEGEGLRLQAQIGYDRETAPDFIPLERGVVGRVARTGQPAFIRDVSQDPDYVASHPEITCEICVPVMSGGTTLGTLNVESDDKRPLTDHDLQLLSILGSHIGVAIENARLYERSQSDFANLSRLFEASSRIGSTLDLSDTLQFIIQAAVDATGGHSATIILTLPEGEAELRATVNYTEELRKASDPRAEGVTAKVVQAGEAVIIPNVPEAREWVNPGMIKAGFGAAACLPLRTATTTLGAMWVNWTQPRHFPKREVELLQTFANQAAIAIENARLYEEEQRRSAQRRTIAEVGRKAAAILEMDALLPQVVDLIAQNFGYDHVHVFQIDPGSEYAVYKAGTGKAGLAIAEEGLQLKVGEEGIIGWVAGHGQPLLVNDVGLNPHYIPHPALPDTRSELSIPIRLGEKIIGVLDVQSAELNAFDERNLDTLQTLADQLAVAMENARLYQETKRLALTDGLTGLYNLRYFYETLEKEIHRSERYGRPVSLIILDIDDFKAYNDLYGHLAGDDLLKELAQLMSKVSRRTDTLTRYGGEEFAVILPETETKEARFLAKRLLEEVREHRFSTQDGQTIGRITISLGVATYPHHADSVKALVDAADKAMLQAKRTGKNRIAVLRKALTKLDPR